MNMKKQHFSLVELLTVIAVIAILAGILIPTVGAIKESGKATQALTEVKGIHLAIKSFQNDHKYLPDTTTSSDRVYFGVSQAAAPTENDKDTAINENASPLHNDYLNLFDIICYTDHSDVSGKSVSSVATAINKKKKKYLNAPQSYYNSDSDKVGYRDPWGRPYIIYLDTNYDKIIETHISILNIGLTQKDSSGNGIISDTVGVLSLGKNSVTTLAEADPEDLCTSWQ